MKHFLDTVETIPKGLGFSHWDSTHILWLLAFAAAAVFCTVLYRKSSPEGKKKIRLILAALLVADELFKIVCLLIGDRFTPKYLPLHLCSINIFLIAYHAVKPNRTLDNFLYAVCLPTSMAALLFPTWTKLPPESFMHMHSFTVHILLALYPLVLALGGTIVPRAKYLPKCILLLLFLAVPAYVCNLIFDTNFMFLMSASKGNPLYLFESAFGSHLIGYPVLATAILTVMYVPLYFIRKYRKRHPAIA